MTIEEAKKFLPIIQAYTDKLSTNWMEGSSSAII